MNRRAELFRYIRKIDLSRMKIDLVAFGIAKDILRAKTMQVELPPGSDLASLRAELCLRHPEFRRLRSLAFAVNEHYQDDAYVLSDRDEVVLIPPVSGG